MSKKNGIAESKPKQCRRQEESAPETPVGRAYAVESLKVGKVIRQLSINDSPVANWTSTAAVPKYWLND